MTAPAYARPTSTTEAVAALQDNPDARPIAGGTDLMVQLRLGHRRPPLVVDTIDLEELHHLGTGASPVIGAGTTLRTFLGDRGLVERYPALAQAATLLGGRQIQAMATIGGNVCNASPAAETITPLLVYAAEAEVTGPNGRRVIPMTSFLCEPGSTVLGPGELLVAVRLPASVDGRYSAYRRMELRRSVDIAIVSASVCVHIEDGRIAEARIAIGAVNSTPMRVPAAETALAGTALGNGDGPSDVTRSAVNEAAIACRAASKPIDDARASARYRAAMVEVIASRAVLAAIAKVERT